MTQSNKLHTQTNKLHVFYRPPATLSQMLDILEDFLHDFQDPTGLLPKSAEQEESGAASAGAAKEAHR